MCLINLGEVENLNHDRPIVAIGKHLCGAATGDNDARIVTFCFKLIIIYCAVVDIFSLQLNLLLFAKCTRMYSMLGVCCSDKCVLSVPCAFLLYHIRVIDCLDLMLRCVTRLRPHDEHKRRVVGVVLALCCHHRCHWRSYVGKRFIAEQCRLSARQFHILCSMSSWATCSSRPIADGRRADGRGFRCVKYFFMLCTQGQCAVKGCSGQQVDNSV